MYKYFKINFFGAPLWLGDEICFVLNLPRTYFVTSPRQIILWIGRARDILVPTGLIKKLPFIPGLFKTSVNESRQSDKAIKMVFNVDSPYKLLKHICNLSIFQHCPMEDSWSFLLHVQIFSNNLIDSSYDT